MNEGRKNDAEKPRMDLISSEAMLQLAKVLTFGAKKYAAHNWRNGIVYSRIIGAIMRHVNAYNAGETLDPETGLSHIAHAMCECMFLLEFEKTHTEMDDRYRIVDSMVKQPAPLKEIEIRPFVESHQAVVSLGRLIDKASEPLSKE